MFYVKIHLTFLTMGSLTAIVAGAHTNIKHVQCANLQNTKTNTIANIIKVK